MPESFLRLDLNTPEHPKISRLISRYSDRGYVSLQRLWIHAAKFNPEDGRFEGLSAKELSAIARAPGKSQEFIGFLVELRLLDSDGETFSVHNWVEREPFFADAPARKARNTRNANKRWAQPEESTGTAEDGASKPAPSLKSAASIDVWFDQEFLAAYPEHHHDQLKTARAYLRKHKPDAAERARILATLELWKASPDWLKDGGKWIKGIGNFFSDGLHLRKPLGVEAGPHYETAAQIASRENGAASASSDPQADAKFHKILDGVMQ